MSASQTYDDLDEARNEGWSLCLNAVRASLEDYPNAGGDIVIMTEVARIVAEALAAADR